MKLNKQGKDGDLRTKKDKLETWQGLYMKAVSLWDASFKPLQIWPPAYRNQL